MKTLDEACRTFSTEDKSVQAVRAANDRYRDIRQEIWRSLEVAILVRTFVEEGYALKQPVHEIALVLFTVGVVVGMEMEKQ